MVGMDENHRTLLRKNRMHLIRDLDGDRVASHLYSKEIFSEEDKALVNAEKTPQQKGEVLLDLLQRRGASAFEVFCDVLRELKMFHLEILLRNDEMTSPSIEKGIDVEDRADGRFQIPIGDLKPLKQNSSEEKSATESDEKGTEEKGHAEDGQDTRDGRWFGKADKQDSSVTTQPKHPLPSPKAIDYNVDSMDYYKMDKYPRGLFLLFNNRDFEPSSGMEDYPRNGTDKDAKELECLFKELGFSVHRYDNVTSYQMRKLCKEAASLNYSAMNCFACAILSHGKEGVIYGTDDTVDIRELTGYFRERNLIGKPKLFMFQACQGSDYMDGVDATDGPADNQTNDISLPCESDFIYAYSTVPGYYSWRNSRNGSWFVQAIVEVFRANAHKMDVLRMLTRVNAIVATKKSATGSRASNNKRQIASIISQLRKEFFLFPPQGPLSSGSD